MFILSLIYDLKTIQVDYVQYFPQEKTLRRCIYENTIIFYYTEYDTNKQYALKLKLNIYGLKQAAYNWNELLSGGLIKLGFQQCDTDPCLFLNKQIIFMIYIDDTIFFAYTNYIIE